MSASPTPLSANIRRHPSGLASVELLFGADQVRACRRCPVRCKAKPIEEGSVTFRCGHRMPQDRLPGFLFGPPREPEPGRKPDPAEFTAASRLLTDILGRKILVAAWTDEAWDEEEHKPAKAWPVRGGGRLYLATLPGPKSDSIAFRPWAGPTPRCWWRHWLDVEAIIGGPADPVCAVYRVSLWPEGIDPLATPADPMTGEGGFSRLHFDIDTYFAMFLEKAKAPSIAAQGAARRED